MKNSSVGLDEGMVVTGKRGCFTFVNITYKSSPTTNIMMTQREFSREISLERLEQLGKIHNSEDDLSTTIFLDKEKADEIIHNILGDIFRENMARFKDGE